MWDDCGGDQCEPGSFTGFNQVIYIDDSSAARGMRGGGVDQRGGAAQWGLTIASGNPVYIQGIIIRDRPAIRFGQHGAADGEQLYPAAVVDRADAVDILSNNWTNSESTSSVGSRAANNTTINTRSWRGRCRRQWQL